MLYQSPSVAAHTLFSVEDGRNLTVIRVGAHPLAADLFEIGPPNGIVVEILCYYKRFLFSIEFESGGLDGAAALHAGHFF